MTEYPHDLNELFSQIGMKLMAAREAKNLTLEDISARTRINLSFLKMIEQGNLDDLPGLTFVKGFIRNYIAVLELKDDELEAEIRRLTLNEADPGDQAITSPKVNVLDSDPRRMPWFRLGLYSVLGIGLVWVGFLVFSAPQNPGPVMQNEAPVGPPAAAPPAGDQPAPSPAPGPEAQPESQSAPAPDRRAEQPAAEQPEAVAPSSPVAATAPAAPPSSPAAPRSTVTPAAGRQRLELTIRGLESTWLRLSIDRAPPIEVLMEPAETVSWQASQEIRLTIGKSQGVAVYLNGEEIVLPPEANRLIPEMVLNRLTLLKLEN